MVDSEKKRNKRRKKVSNNQEMTLVRSSSSLLCTIPSYSTTTSTTKKLIFWGRKFLGNKLSFYIVDIPVQHLKHQKKLKPTIDSVFDHRLIHTRQVSEVVVVDPIFTFTLNSTPLEEYVPLFANSFTLLDSILFTLGGLFMHPNRCSRRLKLETNLVHYIDTQNKDSSWKPTTPMIASRRNPQVLTANRTIYVFGCFGSEKCRHEPTCVWAESFNSSTRDWSPLSVPMLFRRRLIVCSSNPKNRKHVMEKISALVDDGVFYEFHLKTNSWTCVANCEKSFCGIRSCPTMVNNVFYWFWEDVFAYDILNDRNFEGPVQDLSFQRAMRRSTSCRGSDEEDDVNDIKPLILHLGGRYFCLLSSLRDVDENGLMRIHCLIIKVSTTNQCYKLYRYKRRDINTFFLGARVIACQSLHVDQQLDFIDGRLMMI